MTQAFAYVHRIHSPPVDRQICRRAVKAKHLGRGRKDGPEGFYVAAAGRSEFQASSLALVSLAGSEQSISEIVKLMESLLWDLLRRFRCVRRLLGRLAQEDLVDGF